MKLKVKRYELEHHDYDTLEQHENGYLVYYDDVKEYIEKLEKKIEELEGKLYEEHRMIMGRYA